MFVRNGRNLIVLPPNCTGKALLTLLFPLQLPLLILHSRFFLPAGSVRYCISHCFTYVRFVFQQLVARVANIFSLAHSFAFCYTRLLCMSLTFTVYISSIFCTCLIRLLCISDIFTVHISSISCNMSHPFPVTCLIHLLQHISSISCNMSHQFPVHVSSICSNMSHPCAVTHLIHLL